MKKGILAAALLPFLLMGCAVKPAITGKSSYVADSFSADVLQRSGLALLPIVAGEGVEGYRRPFGDAINEAASAVLSKDAYRPWQQTMQLLNDANLVEDYQQAIAAYSSTSIVPRRLIQSMSEATGTQYFMYVTLNSPISTERVTRSVWSAAGTATQENFGVSATGQIWDANGDVVWEGVSKSEVSANSDNFQVISAEERSLEVHSRRAAEALLKASMGIATEELPTPATTRTRSVR